MNCTLFKASKIFVTKIMLKTIADNTLSLPTNFLLTAGDPVLGYYKSSPSR